MITPLFGPQVQTGGVLFRLWAPDAQAVSLSLPGEAPRPMGLAANGFFDLFVADAGPGQRYRFVIGDLEVPDPASRQQDGDVFGWSVVPAPLPEPRQPLPPRPWHEVVLAELHVGTVSVTGDYAGIEALLDHYVAAGITAIELMPVADFAGKRNWGYDGVLPFAPDEAYGSPAALRALVDAAHERGLGVMLDVVYNHFGPEGNFLPAYAGAFFTEAHKTPWGAAIDLDNPLVRHFFVENAVMWLKEYDFDGLRFDAVHAFMQPGGDRLLEEIAAACRAVKPDAWLVLENDNNAARWLARDEAGKPRFYTAQWNDDAHHAFHVVTTGEKAGYYSDYADDPVASLARALTEGFIYQGEASAHRGGTPRGEVSAHLPPEAFVNFAQNHDQIGNRPLGDRLAGNLPAERLALLRFILLLSPAVPMIFQGEEVGLETPFPFFCDFQGDLAEAVRKGRAEEFSAFFAGGGENLPDPLAEETFTSAILPREALTAEAVAPFRALVEARRHLVWPLLATPYRGAALERHGDALLLRWRFEAGTLCLALNAAEGTVTLPMPPADAISLGEIGEQGSEARLGPWSAMAWAESA
ncbi:malto-oligosyltrehalose trehalohydrolase [Acetobacteraceae bacterium H6797]|nr:malto-oligosyltrehalose trehalohydrolase [Acetobacteraceae bacterium H6797]